MASGQNSDNNPEVPPVLWVGLHSDSEVAEKLQTLIRRLPEGIRTSVVAPASHANEPAAKTTDLATENALLRQQVEAYRRQTISLKRGIKTLLHTAEHAILIVDRDLTILERNAHADARFGINPSDLTPDLARIAKCPDLAGRIHGAIQDRKPCLFQPSHAPHLRGAIVPFYAEDNHPEGVVVTIGADTASVERLCDELQLVFDHLPLGLFGRSASGEILPLEPATHQQEGKSETHNIAPDIAVEQEASRALKISEDRLDLAVRASKIGLWDWDIANGTLWWSDRFKEIVGVEDSGFDGKLEDFADRLHPDDRDRVMNAVQAQMDHGTPYDLQYRLRRTDGAYVSIEARGQAIWDGNGNPVRFIGTVDDITEREADTIRLKERGSQLELASQLSGMGYWRVDLVDGSLFWSDQIYVIHGVTPDQYVPELESALSFYHPDDRERVRAFVADAIEQGKSYTFEARIVRPDGAIRSVRAIAQTDEGVSNNVRSVFGVFIDVTEDRRREASMKETLDELARSNEELHRFSYVCSHDLKEPVKAIAAMCDLLGDPELRNDDAQRDLLLDRITVNTRRLNMIVDSLLAYSRVDRKVEYTSLDCNAIVEDIRNELSDQISETHTLLSVGRLPAIIGARAHFFQLFHSLISNAIKFSDKSAPRIRISAQDTEDAVEFRVDDNGPGIPLAHRQQVFEAFRRLHRADVIEGSGLGLAICRRIISQYGGNISIEDGSELGGCRVLFRLPLRD